jgi:hypothetical protein
VPNIKGLDTAPNLLLAHTAPAHVQYGPHATVEISGHLAVLVSKAGKTLASVDFSRPEPRVKADLRAIDGDTVTPVNAFLSPYGKVKAYWRNPGEYRWHPLNGPASRPQGSPNPALAPAAVVAPRAAVPVVPPTVPVVPVSAPVVPHPATNGGVIETVKRWQDRGGKQPVVKAANRAGTWSAVGTIMAPTSHVLRLDSMKRLRDAGQPAFGLITGPAGTGKTSIAEAWAFTHDLPVIIVPGQSIQTASDWFGSITPSTEPGRQFDWVWSDMAKLILTGEPCLIVLDELNRAENERALNGVMDLTDWRGTAKPVGAPHAVTLKPGQMIVATINEGIEYVATVEVDAAVRDRFDAAGIVMSFPPEKIEVRIVAAQAKGIDREVAKKLVRVAATQRAKRDEDVFPSHNVISPRAVVTIAKGIVLGGLDPVESIWNTCHTRFTKDDEDGLRAVIESQFGPEAVAIDDDDDDEVDAFMQAQGL